jgi:hypothetical protein
MALFERDLSFVMPGLVPGIHVFLTRGDRDVDGRDKPGHDETVAVTRA